MFLYYLPMIHKSTVLILFFFSTHKSPISVINTFYMKILNLFFFSLSLQYKKIKNREWRTRSLKTIKVMTRKRKKSISNSANLTNANTALTALLNADSSLFLVPARFSRPIFRFRSRRIFQSCLLFIFLTKIFLPLSFLDSHSSSSFFSLGLS